MGATAPATCVLSSSRPAPPGAALSNRAKRSGPALNASGTFSAKSRSSLVSRAAIHLSHAAFAELGSDGIGAERDVGLEGHQRGMPTVDRRECPWVRALHTTIQLSASSSLKRVMGQGASRRRCKAGEHPHHRRYCPSLACRPTQAPCATPRRWCGRRTTYHR